MASAASKPRAKSAPAKVGISKAAGSTSTNGAGGDGKSGTGAAGSGAGTNGAASSVALPARAATASRRPAVNKAEAAAALPDATAGTADAPQSYLQLLLLLTALGREPEEGWLLAAGLGVEQVAELCRQHSQDLQWLRVLSSGMRLISDDDLAALARAALVDRLVAAASANDTATMLKLIDKASSISARARLAAARTTPASAASAAPAGPPLREYSVEEAVAEARLIVDALEAQQQLSAEALAQLRAPLELLDAPEEGSRLQVLGSSQTEEGVAAASLALKKTAAPRPPLPEVAESWKLEAESSLETGTPVPVAAALAEASSAAGAILGEVVG